MTKGRRFFIFLSSAGIMTFFLFFTLATRSDKPFEKYSEWLPGNRVISMLLEMKNFDGDNSPKQIYWLEGVEEQMDDFKISKLEVVHGLKNGDVEFFHHLTDPRSNPKEYYVLIDIDGVKYAVQASSKVKYTDINAITKPIPNESNMIFWVLSGFILVITVIVLMFRRLFKRFTSV